MSTTIAPDTDPQWSPHPIPTPTLGSGGSLSAIYSTRIAAAPATCASIILDPSSYGTWNAWIPAVAIDNTSPHGALPAPLTRHLQSAATPPGTYLLPGTVFHEDVYMDPSSGSSRRVDLEVVLVEEFFEDGEARRAGLRVAWRTLGSPWYLRAERVQEFVEDGEGGCLYSNYETFYGPLSWAVKMFVGAKLMNGLRLWKDGLKKEAEAREKAGRGVGE